MPARLSQPEARELTPTIPRSGKTLADNRAWIRHALAGERGGQHIPYGPRGVPVDRDDLDADAVGRVDRSWFDHAVTGRRKFDAGGAAGWDQPGRELPLASPARSAAAGTARRRVM